MKKYILVTFGFILWTVLMQQLFGSKASEGELEEVYTVPYVSSVTTYEKGIIIGENDPRVWLHPYNGLKLSRDLGITWEELGLPEGGG